jgi:hypothetical protein
MATSLDPILEARLDLLDQALAEVEEIRKAMAVQRDSLKNIDEFLRPDGTLSGFRRNLWFRLSDAITRLQGPPRALDAEPADKADREEQDEDPQLQALRFVKEAHDMLTELETARSRASKTFQGIRRWSVADLKERQLSVAASHFKSLIDGIRNHPQPWQAYEQQLRGRGEQLFTAYLELLSSISVRGFGVDTELTKDRMQLLSLLLAPKGQTEELPKFPAPNLLTRTEHVQLGYLDWSLWALPLMARQAGLDLIKANIFNTEIPERLRTLCADVYAVYALGPSYPCAVIYLELDPDGTAVDGVSDPVRAEVLLKVLPELGSDVERPELQRRADQLRDAWQEARTAVRAPDVDLSGDDDNLVEKFLDELRRRYSEIGYRYRSFSIPLAWAQHLAAEKSVALPAGILQTPDLLIAMWIGRLDHPERRREIYKRAQELAARIAETVPAGLGRGPLDRSSR